MAAKLLPLCFYLFLLMIIKKYSFKNTEQNCIAAAKN